MASSSSSFNEAEPARLKYRASDSSGNFTLDSIRDSLIRQEDTIVFSLIERAKYPRNSPVYDESSTPIPDLRGSLLQFFVEEAEILQSKVGRYDNLEEHPFFPKNLPLPLLPPSDQQQVLHHAAASININEKIWNAYVNDLLPLFTAEGDDGNYALTMASDLTCLQALSRRIHYGLFVAEVKYRDAPQDYGHAIRAQDRDALMEMLTFESVEEMVKRRAEKKASVFGQEISINDSGSNKQKIDPSFVSHLYSEWVMPLTKLVEVEYLLRCLD